MANAIQYQIVFLSLNPQSKMRHLKQAYKWKLLSSYLQNNCFCTIKGWLILYIIYAYVRCSTCPLVFGCWELSHLIFLMQREKKNCLQIHKMTNDFTLNDNLGLFWVKIVVILWICSALQAVLSFSAWEKSRDSTRNRPNLEDT